jgi:hypothetical protein
MNYRKYLNWGFALLLANLILVSCNDDDTLEGVRGQKQSVVTIDQTSADAAEGQELSFTLTVDKPLSTPMDFKLEVVDGESTASFRDFTTSGSETDISAGGIGQGKIGYDLTFPAYATSYTFTITPIVDLLPEDTETLKLLLRSSHNGMGLVAPGSEYITINIANTVSDDFVMILNWDAPATDSFGTIHPGTYIGADGSEYDLCGFDFDLELYDADFNVVDDSYSSCPEEITLSADAPDGDYIIIPSFYTNAVADDNAVPAGELKFPVTLTLAKPGVFNHVVDMTQVWTYAIGGDQEGNPDAYIPAAIVTKSGTTYTVTDYNTGTVLAQGRMASLINKLKHKRTKG